MRAVNFLDGFTSSSAPDVTSYIPSAEKGAALGVCPLDAGIKIAVAYLPTISTTNLSEGTNLFYTQARFDTAFSVKTTSDLGEGSNLYFTDLRAKTASVLNSTAGSQTDQAPSVSAMKDYVTANSSSPVTTTKGDIEVHNGTTRVRLPVGSNGKVPTANSSATEGLEYKYPRDLVVQTKTAAYTALVSDDLIVCDTTAGAFTLTLPTAVGNTGKVFHIKNIYDTADRTTHRLTVDANGTETIDGELTLVMSSKWDSAKIVSNGSNWVIIENNISYCAHYWNLNGQSIVDGNALKYASRRFDTHGIYDPTTGNITLPKKGRFRVTATSRSASDAATVGNSYSMDLTHVTGAYNIATAPNDVSTSTSARTYMATVTGVVTGNKGDVAVVKYNESMGTLTNPASQSHDQIFIEWIGN